ncbi:hypothetical protein [Fodinibius salsisoli]|uniref:Uncharacterized protein n=1 Tax=Fodinibius salsisoli TaxID=2820877 RepID=A0ABT3PIN9_9BACT|nr:hypothetical protein [Fodinibius salsisoli]MCW9705795.1 hypothetical protein [Fodinibius salsisoli]
MLSDILGLLGGVSVIITGLMAYFGKGVLELYKSYLKKTSKRLDALYNRANHVSKSQFDTEFQIYQEVWELLVPLKQNTLQLRPMGDSVDPNKTEEERIKERLSNLQEAFIDFRDTIEKNKPFYSKEVYKKLDEIRHICRKEAIQYQHTSQDWEKYWKSQEENREKITSLIDEGCELIRNRIKSLKIVED